MPVLEMSEHERRSREQRGRGYALAFDRVRVFDDLFRTDVPTQRPPGGTVLRRQDAHAEPV